VLAAAVKLLLLLLALAEDQIVLPPGAVREIDARYVDRYRCQQGLMIVERQSRLSSAVTIRCP